MHHILVLNFERIIHIIVINNKGLTFDWSLNTVDFCIHLSDHVYLFILISFLWSIFFCFIADEDSNLAASPMPDMDSDSMLVGPVDEEERWLDALEKGELDDNGELKKEVDESLLTARQVRTSSSSPNFVGFAFPFSPFACCWSLCRRFRKPCYTSSRASRCWSSPWATRRRRWRPRWCKSGRSEPRKDGCRLPRRQRRTRTRRSRGWPKPARPRSKAWRRGSPSRASVPWSATATLSWVWPSPSPQEFPPHWLRPLVLHQQQQRPVESMAAPTWRSTRAQRLVSLSAASTATGGTFCWFRAQPELCSSSCLWTVIMEKNGLGYQMKKELTASNIWLSSEMI